MLKFIVSIQSSAIIWISLNIAFSANNLLGAKSYYT